MSNNNFSNTLNQLKTGLFADQKGYWLARNFQSFPGADKLPFADFYELLDGNHKKMWLGVDKLIKEDRMTYTGDSLIPLYQGIVDTQQSIVSNGYFIYSALVINLHCRLSFYSRKFACEPSVKAVVNQLDATATADITKRALALRIAAYIIYEGDGLGGYKDNTWLLWGRLRGHGAADNKEVLSDEQAGEDFDLFNSKNMTLAGKKELFYQWWCEISDDHAQVDRQIVDHIFSGYRLVSLYKALENPRSPQEFDKNSIVDVQAALCGFLSRASKGLGEALGYDPNENEGHRFADMLSEASPEKLDYLLKGHLVDQSGKRHYTPFGSYMMNLLMVHNLRNDITDKVVRRATLAENVQQGYKSLGFRVSVDKRGRR